MRALLTRALFGRARGTSAVEFGLLAPIFFLLFAAVVDLGGTIYTRLLVESAVSAGANFALVNQGNVSSTNGASLAASIGTIVAGSVGGTLASGKVVVNNGPTVTVTNGVAGSSGVATNADSCYCPSGLPGAWSWGTAVTCGAACTGGGIAGKFVTLVVSQTYTPFFSNYAIVQNGTITATAIVQAQ